MVISYTYNKKLLDWLRFQSIGTRDYVVERLSVMFMEVDPQRILIGQFVISFGLGAIVFLMMLPQVVPGLFFGSLATAVGWKAPKPIVDWLYQRRVEKFVVQMIDGLSLMSNAMKSGLSISQALGVVVAEMPDPIKQEFNLVLNQNKLGVPLEEAFISLSKRVISDDVEMFVTAINILKETGGNLAETFDTIVLTIRERIKVENKIKAITAQGLYQGMVLLCVPPGMLVTMFQADPDMMKPLFTTQLGWLVLTVAVMLEFAAIFMIRRVIRVDV